MTEMDGHWHVFTAMPGYLPESDIGTATSWHALASMLQEEFADAADHAAQQADGLAEGEEYKDAWHTLKLSEELAIHGTNFGTRWDRIRNGQVPEEEAAKGLQALIEAIFGHENGGSVAISKETHLYANPCTEGESCEHLEDDDDA